MIVSDQPDKSIIDGCGSDGPVIRVAKVQESFDGGTFPRIRMTQKETVSKMGIKEQRLALQ